MGLIVLGFTLAYLIGFWWLCVVMLSISDRYSRELNERLNKPAPDTEEVVGGRTGEDK